MVRRASSAISRAGGVIVEALERRQLLSTVWQVGGTEASDTILLRIDPADLTRVRVTVNSKTQVKPLVGLQRIIINARGGHDHVTLDIPPAVTRLRVTVDGWTGNDTILGSAVADELIGGAGNDRVHGNGGNDTIHGGLGNDLLSGDDGDDFIDGGYGNDTVAGGLGTDLLVGGPGSDQLSGGYGNDALKGMQGRDTLRGGDGIDALFGGEDRDADVVYREPADRWKRSVFDRALTDNRDTPLSPVADAAALKEWAIAQSLMQWKWAFGQQVSPWDQWDWNAPIGLPTDAGSGSAEQRNDFSGTNTQEQGIDEADLVKTDGQFIYMVKNDELIVMDAWPAEESRIVSRTPLDRPAEGLYLNGTRLTVVSSAYGWWWDGPMMDATARLMPGYHGGYDPTTLISVYNVAEGVPSLVDTTKFDGTLTGSRNIDGRMYLVLDTNLDLPRPLTIADPANDVEYYESAESYAARIAAMDPAQFLPQYTITADGTESPGKAIVSHDALFSPGNGLETSLLTVVLMDVTAPQPQPIDSAAVMGSGHTVYASAESIYVARQAWDAPIGLWSGDARTDLYRFGLGEAEVAYEGTGHVAGFVINSFAMDEQDGDFRIATTSTQGGLSNNLFVLRDQGEKLGIVGALTNLAFSERIYSVRFMADRAYIVTFRQVDPLFVIDLSNPTKPKVAGELKIPGYSAYLHPIGGGLLIGLGRDADDSGRVGALQASLFNVSNPAKPVRIDTFSFSPILGTGWQWSGSQAEYDHHAFSYFAEAQLMAVPVSGYSSLGADSRLVLVSVGPKGFSAAGQVKHTSDVLRSLRIESFIYSVSGTEMHVVPIAAPSQIVATVPFAEEPPPVDDNPPGEGESVTGLLRNDMVAIGGDTTGWAIDTADGRIEVDVSAIIEQAKALAGQQVKAGGEYVQVQYVERGLVTVLKVLTLAVL